MQVTVFIACAAALFGMAMAKPEAVERALAVNGQKLIYFSPKATGGYTKQEAIKMCQAKNMALASVDFGNVELLKYQELDAETPSWIGTWEGRHMDKFLAYYSAGAIAEPKDPETLRAGVLCGPSSSSTA